MTKLPKRKLESYEKRTNNPSFAWEILFDKYDIVKEVEDNGFYDINTKQMMRNKDVVALWQQEHGSKPIPDNRNILKFDFSTDLPNIFKEYRLQIMPIGKNTYRIAPFDMYQPLPNKTMPIMPITSPIKIASLDFNKITTEPNAQTVAEITGMLTYIFHDLDSENRTVVGTLSGKNNVSNASFSVKSQISKTPITFDINTWQSETDGVYESDDSVLILESKMKFPKDFNIRQLFVPRLLVEQIMNDLDVHKDVYAGYFVKTKDIYIFTVYKFTDLSYMNSITFKRQYKFRLSDDPANIYQIEDTSKQQLNDVQTIESVQQLIKETPVNDRYPQYSNGQYVSFPQANNLQIALDYLALLSGQDKYITDNDEEIATTSAEAFVDAFKYDKRQYGYYFNWLGYFGLVDRDKESGKAIVTERGRQFNNAQFSERNWMLVKLMATHLSSRVILESLLRKTSISNVQVEQAVKQEMKNLPENKKISRATVPRRISGIKSMCKQVLAQMEIFD